VKTNNVVFSGGEGPSGQKDLQWVKIGGARHVLECLIDEDDWMSINDGLWMS